MIGCQHEIILCYAKCTICIKEDKTRTVLLLFDAARKKLAFRLVGEAKEFLSQVKKTKRDLNHKVTLKIVTSSVNFI